MHPLLMRAVAHALQAVFVEGRQADKVLEHALRNMPKAGSRDRAFIAETTYEVVRHYRRYREILGREPHAEADFWQLAGIHFALQGLALPDWKEFHSLKTDQIREAAEKTGAQRAVRESYPDWLDQRAETELGNLWPETAAWLNKPADVVLRANRLKTTRQDLQQSLQAEGVDTQAVGDADALVLRRRQNVFRTKSFQNGLFEVQDFSSQLVAPLLRPEPGMRVVDACAGGGGKALHLAALLHNKGQLIALDTHSWKLEELRRRARRAGATNIETRPIDSRKTIKRLYGQADRLLLDVPCSGLGILRRNPDTKWKLQPDRLQELQHLQQDILQSYSPITKPGGLLLYATCSILPSENRQQIDSFLQSPAGQDFQLLEEKSILPQTQGFDGFYMALLLKK